MKIIPLILIKNTDSADKAKKSKLLNSYIKNVTDIFSDSQHFESSIIICNEEDKNFIKKKLKTYNFSYKSIISIQDKLSDALNFILASIYFIDILGPKKKDIMIFFNAELELKNKKKFLSLIKTSLNYVKKGNFIGIGKQLENPPCEEESYFVQKGEKHDDIFEANFIKNSLGNEKKRFYESVDIFITKSSDFLSSVQRKNGLMFVNLCKAYKESFNNADIVNIPRFSSSLGSGSDLSMLEIFINPDHKFYLAEIKFDINRTKNQEKLEGNEISVNSKNNFFFGNKQTKIILNSSNIISYQDSNFSLIIDLTNPENLYNIFEEFSKIGKNSKLSDGCKINVHEKKESWGKISTTSINNVIFLKKISIFSKKSVEIKNQNSDFRFIYDKNNLLKVDGKLLDSLYLDSNISVNLTNDTNIAQVALEIYINK